MEAPIIRKLKIKYSVDSHQTGIESTNQDDSYNGIEDTRPQIWLRVPFLGVQGEFLVKKPIKKIQRNLTVADLHTRCSGSQIWGLYFHSLFG